MTVFDCAKKSVVLLLKQKNGKLSLKSLVAAARLRRDVVVEGAQQMKNETFLLQ